ncbi:FDX6 [Auxenochlorella protothecoides x Auxenochlorella symbiontica]
MSLSLSIHQRLLPSPCTRVRAPNHIQHRRSSSSVAAGPPAKHETDASPSQRRGIGLGDLLGPIGLTVGSGDRPVQMDEASTSAEEQERHSSISSLTTEEWRKRNERNGYVDLWVEDEFNSGSRLVGGRAAHLGLPAGLGSGEGPSVSKAPRHSVKIHNHYADQEVEVEVPEDRYILYEAESQGLELPYACRMGCCTACAVKVESGELYQPQSLGISQGLKDQGYALMCVGYPRSDLVLSTVPEDEVYDLQFGRAFQEQATDLDSGSILRDDFAIELALGDE